MPSSFIQSFKILNTRYKNIHQEVIDRCREGDRQAQSQLYKLYYKAMYSVSFRILNDSMEAEDVMQEAFLSAFRNIESYKGQVSFGAWLKRIVVNRSLDQLKKRRIKFEEVTEKTAQISESEMETTAVNIQTIKEAIQDLPDGYRVVLSLFLIEGYDHEEISSILGITNSSSRTQLLRAKNKLRNNLAGKELFSNN